MIPQTEKTHRKPQVPLKMPSWMSYKKGSQNGRNTTKKGNESSAARPYVCTLCGVSFSMQWQLRRHIKVHTGEKPHKCEICGRAFGEKDTLVKHIRTHTGEKPYICVVCGRGFAQSGVMKSHMSTHVTVAGTASLQTKPS